MTTERVAFRLNAALSLLPPLAFAAFTLGWCAGLVSMWADLTWIVRIPAILFVVWLLSWWVRLIGSALRMRRGRQTVFVNLPWKVGIHDEHLEFSGLLLRLRVVPDQVVRVSPEAPGIARILVRFEGQIRSLLVFGGKAGVERIVEWCFMSGVRFDRGAQSM